MEKTQGRQSMHASFKQKKKLISFMARHPELISSKVTTNFTYEDRQRLWQAISDECNNLPGARKHWRQWRKTWQDLRSKYKKHYGCHNGNLPPMLAMLSTAEQEALGLKSSQSEVNNDLVNTPNPESSEQKLTEFVQMDSEGAQENNFFTEMDVPTYSEPDSPPEQKVFTSTNKSKINKLKRRSSSSKHTGNCVFNCDLLAAHEKKKLELKQEYMNFKKNYLKQKLKLIKEQTEALKTIARELSDT